jgi:hypothetical protein
VPGLDPSVSLGALGAVDLRCGENASFSLPTGDALLLMSGSTSKVCACFGVRLSSTEVAESTRVPSAEVVESIVSDAIRGDERVR